MKAYILYLSGLLLVTGYAHGKLGKSIYNLYETYRDASQKDGDLDQALIDAIKTDDKDKVEGLIEHKANVNAKNEYGYSALHSAVARGNAGLVDLLLKAGADVNDNDNFYGTSPLQWAVQLEEIPEITHILIKSGANVNAVDKHNQTPLYMAVGLKRVDIVKELLNAGANPSIKSKSGRSPIDAARTAEMRELLQSAMKKNSAFAP